MMSTRPYLEASNPLSRRGFRVLVVEDDRILAAGVVEELARRWCTTTLCMDGKTALREAANGNFDLIYTGILMPFMNGLDLLKALKEYKVKTPVVVVTALVREFEPKCREAGAIGYEVLGEVYSFEVLVDSLFAHYDKHMHCL